MQTTNVCMLKYLFCIYQALDSDGLYSLESRGWRASVSDTASCVPASASISMSPISPVSSVCRGLQATSIAMMETTTRPELTVITTIHIF